MRRILLLLLVSLFGTAGAQDELVVPLDHWSYPVVDRFQVLGLINVLPTSRPWTRGEVRKALQPLFQRLKDEPSAFSRSDRYGTHKLKEEFGQPVWDRAQRTSADKTALSFRDDGKHVGLDLSLVEKGVLPREGKRSAESDVVLEVLGAYKNSFAFDEQITFVHTGGFSRVDSIVVLPKGISRTWRGGWISVDRAYFRARLPWLEAEVGRDNLWWGPGRFGTLLLSDNMPLDALSLSAGLGIARMNYFHATLSANQGQYLAGHRLSLRLSHRTQIGFGETALYTARNPEPGYVNPLIPYYAAQHLRGIEDNILWNFELETTPLPGLKLYGELLMDDYQYEHDPPAPNKLGYLAGFHVASPFGLPNLDLKGEYARINRWVYTHIDSNNTYLYGRHPLGHWLGPDADDFRVSLTFRPYPRWTLEGIYELERHGEGRDLAVGWHPGDDPATRALSGVVEKTQKPALRIAYEPTWWLNVSVEDRYRDVKNLGNIANQSFSRNELEGKLRLNF